MAGTVIVGGVDTHPGARDSVLAEGNSGGDRLLLERAVLLVEVKLVGLRVVGNRDIGPAVVVVVEDRETEALRSRIVHPGLLRRVLELAAAQVVPQADRCSLVRLRRAVRLVRAV